MNTEDYYDGEEWSEDQWNVYDHENDWYTGEVYQEEGSPEEYCDNCGESLTQAVNWVWVCRFCDAEYIDKVEQEECDRI